MNQQHTDRFLEKVKSRVPDPRDAKDPQATLLAIYSAVIQADLDQLAGLVTEDVELRISGFAPFNGAWRGREEMVTAIRNNLNAVEDQKPQIDSLLSQGDDIVVLLSESGIVRSDGQPYKIRGVQWFTFLDGKLKRVDEILAMQ
jgi:ketosteroid isomerase-like protein